MTVQLFTRHIVAHGVTVTPEQQIEAWGKWMTRDQLQAPDLADELIALGVPEMVKRPLYYTEDAIAEIVADRMIQKAKKSGVIEHISGGHWRAIGDSKADA